MLPDYEDNQDSNIVKAKLLELLTMYRYPLLILLIGFLCIGVGVFFWLGGFSGKGKTAGVEVLEATASAQTKGGNDLIVEISGAIRNAGVYKLSFGSRIDDLINAAGGVTDDADREWMGRSLNRAAKLTDGQKLYIPRANEQSSSESASQVRGVMDSRTIISEAKEGVTNINEATQSKLEQLPGIGPVYAQKIIEQRPYSTIDELLSKDVVTKSIFEKIKAQISVY